MRKELVWLNELKRTSNKMGVISVGATDLRCAGYLSSDNFISTTSTEPTYSKPHHIIASCLSSMITAAYYRGLDCLANLMGSSIPIGTIANLMYLYERMYLIADRSPYSYDNATPSVESGRLRNFNNARYEFLDAVEKVISQFEPVKNKEENVK